MEFCSSRAYGPVDSRVLLSSYINDQGIKEIFPLNSFIVEHLLHSEQLPANVYTSDTNTPNTFFSEISQQAVQASLTAATQPQAALSKRSMYYYEYAAWAKPAGSDEIGVFSHSSSLQLYNPLSNVRWVLVSSILPNRPVSLSKVYPAIVWAERELQDMLNLKFNKLKDSRRLLLDYKLQKGVLLKRNADLKQCVAKFSNYSDLYYS